MVDLALVRFGVDWNAESDEVFRESIFSRLELREIDETSPVSGNNKIKLLPKLYELNSVFYNFFSLRINLRLKTYHPEEIIMTA